MRIKYVVRLTAGQAPAGEDVGDTGDLPFLQGCAEFGRLYPIAQKYCDTANKLAQKGDWLISVRAPVGRINLADRSYGIGRGLASIRAERIDNSFLGYTLLAKEGELSSISSGSRLCCTNRLRGFMS